MVLDFHPHASSAALLLLAYATILVLCALSIAHVQATPTTFNWKDLSEEELKGWFSLTDLCVIDNHSDRKLFPQEFRSVNCSQYSRGSKRMHCGVGMGANTYPCYGPFSMSRPSFRRGIDGFTDYKAKPLLSALNLLKVSNSTLILLGDSTMRQKLQALSCEVTREDPQIQTSGNLYGVVPCLTTYWLYYPDGSSYKILSIAIGPMATNCLKMGWRKWALAGGIFENAKHLVNLEQFVNKRNVFIIANTGLWYNEPIHFRKAVEKIMDWLQDVAMTPMQENVVAWHETVSQHWRSTTGSGYFDKTVVDQQEAEWSNATSEVSLDKFLVPNCCDVISNKTEMADWRNAIPRQILAMGNHHQIKTLPMVDITRPLADLHTCNPYYRHDCTHYCYHPLMYQPLWYQMLELAQSAYEHTSKT